MEAAAFFLADHAEAVNGKLYVTGGVWDTLWVGTLPAQHGHLAIVTAIRVPWQATNQLHSVEIDMVDADGHSKFPQPIRGQFEAGRPPGMRAGDESSVVLVFVIEGLLFEKQESYRLTLMVNGTELSHMPLKIALNPNTPMVAPPRP